jgi:hypothetical protein
MLNDKTSPAAIAEVIQAALEERTMSLEAIDAIKLLRDDHIQLQMREDESIADIRTLKATLSATKADLAQTKGYLKAFQEREQSLLDRELKCIKTEVENEYLIKANDDKMTLMLSLTRNLEHRRNLMDNKNGQGPNGEYTNTSVHADEKSEQV